MAPPPLGRRSLLDDFFFCFLIRKCDTVFRVTRESFVLSVTHLGSFVFLSGFGSASISRRSKTQLGYVQTGMSTWNILLTSKAYKKNNLQRHHLLYYLTSFDLSASQIHKQVQRHDHED